MNQLDIAEYQAFQKEKLLSLSTHEELVKFSKQNPVFWWYGEGLRIQALISTEVEFIDFIQKCGVTKLWGNVVPFWVSDDECGVFKKHLYFKDTVASSKHDTIETLTIDGELAWESEVQRFPTRIVKGYECTYNEYFDKPFRINEIEVLTFSPETDIGVKPEIIAKFPAVVTFLSQDSFDRLSGLEVCDLRIHSLKELNNIAIPA